MFATESHILVVDDDPDVLTLSRLALRGLDVFGLPLRIHAAASKAEAIELLGTTLSTGVAGVNLLSVAFIDVVMETDHAGLELCEYIRDDLRLRFPQIYIRTGQPGVAPQRSVVDRYDINGYIAKTDATEDELYSMVKSGVRQAHFNRLAMVLQDGLYVLIPVARTRRWIAEELDKLIERLQSNSRGERQEGLDIRACFLMDDRMMAGRWEGDGQMALQGRTELRALPPTPLSEDGDVWRAEGNDTLLSIAPSSANAEVDFLFRGTVPALEWDILLYHGFTRALAALWKRAT